MKAIERIHHISATVGDPNENLHFYRDILGLRLVKKTVNFENDETYHLYFANEQVDNGTIISFFPRVDNFKGRVGAGQVGRISFLIPKNSLESWKIKLGKYDIEYTEDNRLSTPSLFFNDPHGIALSLIESEFTSDNMNILGFYGIELLSVDADKTSIFLMNEMGLQLLEANKDYYLLQMVGEEKHKVLVNRKHIERGRLGIGTVHHIAWSVKDVEELKSFGNNIENQIKVTDIKDRKYFKSIYFKEPGNIIYELATEGPGFAVDESPDHLGSKLMLPDKYESKRQEIENRLPKLID